MNNIFEEENIGKVVWKLGVPAMLGSLTTLIYNMADTYFVSLTRDPATIAAVTLCTPVLLIIMSIACIFGMGGSSVIARLLGEGRKEDAAQCFRFCMYAMAASGVLVMILGLWLMQPAAGLIGADTENYAYTCDYLKWIYIGAIAIMLANGLVHTFRSAGLIKEATIGLAIGNGVNIVFDWILIVLCRMGTAGAAIATSFGFVCASVYYIAVLVYQRRKGSIFGKTNRPRFAADPAMIADVIRIGIPGALVTVMLSVSNIVLNNYIGIYGSNAVASYGIAYKIDLFPVMILVGLSQGTAPLFGYYFGQRDAGKLFKGVKLTTMDGMLVGAVFTVLIFFGNRIFARVFLSDEELIRVTAWFLRLLCFHAPFIAVINTVTAYFQALGKAVHSLLITVLRNIVLFIPGIMIMNRLFGLNGVILTQLVVEIIVAGICLILYAVNKPERLTASAAKI